MPEISRFLGIIIYMYFNDHQPPHFHAHYNDHKILVTFTDGRTGEIDFRRVVSEDTRPIVMGLRDIEKFRHFKVNFDTICWSNGLDLAPEYLYFLAFGSGPNLAEQVRKWGYLDKTNAELNTNNLYGTGRGV